MYFHFILLMENSGLSYNLDYILKVFERIFEKTLGNEFDQCSATSLLITSWSKYGVHADLVKLVATCRSSDDVDRCLWVVVVVLSDLSLVHGPKTLVRVFVSLHDDIDSSVVEKFLEPAEETKKKEKTDKM